MQHGRQGAHEHGLAGEVLGRSDRVTKVVFAGGTGRGVDVVRNGGNPSFFLSVCGGSVPLKLPRPWGRDEREGVELQLRVRLEGFVRRGRTYRVCSTHLGM